MSKVYVFFADGFEEIEGLTVVDMMRRAGADTVMVSVSGNKTVCGAHKIRIEADELFENGDFSDADMLVLPGGMPGTLHLLEHRGLAEVLEKADESKTGIAAICAAPRVLGSLGLLKGREAVCYPGVEEHLTGADVCTDNVVTDGHITTSRGLGTAIDFSLELISRLFGPEKAAQMAKSIVYR
ncbi:MAG: DJ-1/PfpI family protein [Eubacteriales bacterium]|nr:DJ-1/PfpI family protein [Eubacteriales bacterium]